MGSGVSTVQEYLDNLEPDRREVVSAVREVISAAMPDGYEEAIAYGMIGWSVPLERYPDTYNGQPLGYVALAAQKRYYSLYLNALYAGSVDETEFRRRWEDSGRKLDMGKSCLRFRKLEDLNLDLIAETVAGTPVDAYIARYEQARAR
ncbi:MAG TPA: DUF1801 domain-containing protein [Jiangellaceae bacterium]|nr:DUF1801 domain-containing protein [Jiangellaceae bacterium]